VHSYTYQGLYSLVSTNSFSDNFDSDQKTWRHIFPVTELHLLLPLHTYILVVQTLFRTISIRTKKNFAPHFPSYWITYITYFFGQFRFGQKKKLRATFSQLLNYIYYILFSDNFDSDKKTWRHIFPVTNLHLLHTFSDNFDSDKKLGAAFSQLLNYYSD
jgi:hypothetical protein